MKKEKEVLYPLTKAEWNFFLGNFFTVQSTKEVFDGNTFATGAFVKSGFDPEAMEKAYNMLVKNNDALRLVFVRNISGVKQRFSEFEYEALPRIICKDKADFEEKLYKNYPLMNIWKEKACYGVIGICEDNNSGGLMLYTHHINSDGYSIQLFIDGLEEYYCAYINGEEPKKEFGSSFAKYIEEEKQYLKGPQFKKDRHYWRDKYRHQRDFSFPAGRTPFTNTLKSKSFVIEGEEYDLLMEFCKKNKSSFPAAIMTLLALTTYCVTGKENFCLYNLFHGRLLPKYKKTVGDMFNTYPLFYDVPGDERISTYISENYGSYVEAMTHGRFPASSQIMMCARETYIKRFGYNYIWLLMSYYEVPIKNGEKLLELMTPTEKFIVGIFYCAVFNDSNEHRVEFIENYQSKCISDECAQRIMEVFKRILKLSVENDEMTINELRYQLSSIASGIHRRRRKEN